LKCSYPPKLAPGRLARIFVDDNWCPIHGGDNHQLAHLLATELVTNAVRYGGPPITLTRECRGREGVLLSVSDGSNDLPERMDVGPQALGGRGVRLVDLLSADWGVEHHTSTADTLNLGAPRARSSARARRSGAGC